MNFRLSLANGRYADCLRIMLQQDDTCYLQYNSQNLMIVT